MPYTPIIPPPDGTGPVELLKSVEIRENYSTLGTWDKHLVITAEELNLSENELIVIRGVSRVLSNDLADLWVRDGHGDIVMGLMANTTSHFDASIGYDNNGGCWSQYRAIYYGGSAYQDLDTNVISHPADPKTGLDIHASVTTTEYNGDPSGSILLTCDVMKLQRNRV